MLTTQLIDLGTSFYMDQLATGSGIFGWLPQLETVGQTTVAYSYASQAAGFGLSILGVAVLGYWAGSRLDLTIQYRPLLGYLAVGGGAGHLLSTSVLGLLVGESVLQFGYGSPLYLGLLLGVFVATGLQYALVGLAGAALAEFGVDPIPRPDGSASASADPNPWLGPE